MKVTLPIPTELYPRVASGEITACASPRPVIGPIPLNEQADTLTFDILGQQYAVRTTIKTTYAEMLKLYWQKMGFASPVDCDHSWHELHSRKLWLGEDTVFVYTFSPSTQQEQTIEVIVQLSAKDLYLALTYSHTNPMGRDGLHAVARILSTINKSLTPEQKQLVERSRE